MNQYSILAVQYSLPNNLSRAINSTYESLEHCYYMVTVSKQANDHKTYNFNVGQIGERTADIIRYCYLLRNACKACRPIF